MRKRIRLVVMLAIALFPGACHSDGPDLGVAAPTLNRMLERSARDDPTLEQTARRLEAARALARSATDGFYPNGGLSGLANAGTGKATRDDLLRRPAQFNLEMGVEIAATDMNAARLAIATQVASTHRPSRSPTGP